MANIKYKNDPIKREKYLEYFKQVYTSTKEQKKAYHKQFYSIPENRLKYLLTQAKSRARQNHIEFNISYLDLEIPTHCKYLGIELTNNQGQGRLDTNMSLDRIDSTKGYIVGNVQIISELANRMKNSATIEQLIMFANGVLKVHV